MSLDDMSMLMNGQENPAQPQIDLTVNATLEVTVTDEYTSMREGAPAELHRTFDVIDRSQSMEMEIDVMGQVQSNSSSTGAKSDLVGTTVVFRWDEDAEEYVTTFPDDGGDPELLENLAEDMDLRTLLPDGEVSEGDEWKIEPIDLKDIFAPGGDLKLVPEESDGEDMFGMNPDMGSQEDWFSEDVEGEVTATFKGTRKTDEGVLLGVIVLSIEISNAVDMTEKAREGLAAQDLPPGVDKLEVNSTDIEISIKGEATLLWDIAQGCAHSFEFSAEVSLLVDSSMGISAQGMDMDIEQTMELSGHTTTRVTVE
jgi:hypothetical protein